MISALPAISPLAKVSLIISLTAAAFLPATAALPSSGNETAISLQGHDNGLAQEQQQQPFILLRDPWPASHGMPPQFNIRPASWHLLRKRQCLENGSNFCFDNEEDSCKDCGICCTAGDSQWCCLGSESCCSSQKCCEAGTTCCGDGCCNDGETCNAGKCEVPIVTKTTTTTVKTTLTTTEVEMVTVQKLVVETSTVNSIVTTTVTSTDGTQTEVTFSTTTVAAPAKRALSTPTPVAKRWVEEEEPEWEVEEACAAAEPPARMVAVAEPPRGLVRRTFSSLWRNLVYGGRQAPLDRPTTSISPTEPRKCAATTTRPLPRNLRRLAKRQGDGTSTAFVTVTVTSTDHTTIEQTKTTTVFSTSVSKTTMFQTSTIVVGATRTVSTTSIITITAREATTQTITSTSTFLVDPTGLPVDGDPNGDGDDGGDPSLADDGGGGGTNKKKKGLSGSAVIGIGVGAGLVGLTALLGVLFFWRRHRKNRTPRVYDFTYSPPAPQMTSPTPPSPRKPTLPFFGGAGIVPAHHHDASYTPTVSEMQSEPTPDPHGASAAAAAAGAGAGGAAAAAAAAGRGHTRNTSSVSRPPLVGSGQPSPDDPYRGGGSHQSWQTNASELPTEPRYELGDEQHHQQQQQQQFQPQQPPPQAPPPRSHFRSAPHPSTSSISRVTRFAELDGSGQGRIS